MNRLIAKYKAEDEDRANVNTEAITNTTTIPLVVNSNGRKGETA